MGRRNGWIPNRDLAPYGPQMVGVMNDESIMLTSVKPECGL